MAIIEILSFY